MQTHRVYKDHRRSEPSIPPHGGDTFSEKSLEATPAPNLCLST